MALRRVPAPMTSAEDLTGFILSVIHSQARAYEEIARERVLTPAELQALSQCLGRVHAVARDDRAVDPDGVGDDPELEAFYQEWTQRKGNTGAGDNG